MNRDSSIFDKLKEQLNNLPFLKKKQPAAPSDDVENLQEELAGDNDDAETDGSAAKPKKKSSSPAQPAWKITVAKQLPFLAKVLKIDADEVSSGDTTDTNIKAPDDSQKKRQMIIRGVIVVGILVAASEFLFPTEEEPTEAPPEEIPAHLRKKKKRPRPGEEAPPVAADATTPTDVPAPTETPAVTETPVPTAETPVVTETPPVTTEAPVLTEEAPSEPVVTETPVEPTSESPVVSDTPTDVVIPTDTPSTDTVTTDVPTTEPEAPTTSGESSTDDQVVETETPPPTEADMTDKILQDLEAQLKTEQAQNPTPVVKEYTPPPTYDYVGRGLVYNCRGKHWACIDAGSYKLCQQNYGYLKDQSKSKECYPDSVYQTDRACGWVQKSKITGNSQTDFCN